MNDPVVIRTGAIRTRGSDGQVYIKPVIYVNGGINVIPSEGRKMAWDSAEYCAYRYAKRQASLYRSSLYKASIIRTPPDELVKEANKLGDPEWVEAAFVLPDDELPGNV